MKGLLAGFRDSPERPRLLLLGLCGALAAAVGFVLVPPGPAGRIITHFGYYYILGVFAAFVWYTLALVKSRRAVALGWLRQPGAALAAIIVGSLFLYWVDPFKHKILFDEYVLQATAYQMHATKEVSAIVRAYDINGTWLTLNTFLDKRPYFFAFLVSLLHDFTGYRLANMFALNIALTPIFLGLVYWIAREVVGKAAALFVLLLLVTLPLLGQNVSCAGMELHNLTMIMVEMTLALLYLRVPDATRLSLLVLGAVLLSQSRYESVIFVAPVAIVILLGWRRAGRVILSWPAVLAPLLLIPYAWHNRVLSASPLLWQLNPGQTARFSTTYLSNNLDGAAAFFFNRTNQLANSWFLSVVGLLGFGAAAYRGWTWWRSADRRALPDATLVVLLFGLGIAANLGILMFYYWSRLDDVIAARFALPMCVLLALAAGVLVRTLQEKRLPAMRVALIAFLLWFMGWDLEAYASKQYTNKNLVMEEIDWEHDFLARQPGRTLFISDRSTIPFVLWHIPTILIEVAAYRSDQLRFHLQAGTFTQILVSQELRATTKDGEMGVDPGDFLPPAFHLETLKIQRFGSRWTRISRLVSIEAPKPAPAKPAGVAFSAATATPSG